MKIIKALIVAIAFCLPLTSFALTDDEQVVFTDALRNGNLKVVKQYLDNGSATANEKSFAWSALQMAADKGHLEIVKLLVEKGAELDYAHPVNKMTALHMAAYSGHDEVVKYLLSKGANPNKKMSRGVSILRAVKDQGHTSTVAILEAAGAKDDGCQGDCN
ncbi:MAG TPA: ankyrin repeat domain-containing protein [Methylophilaceae bacterium]|nr:ankyrin repeat domain-containing protein [Methylophilaceae bacterium]